MQRPVCCLQSGQLTPIDLIVEEHFHRAAPGGMGGTKAAGNYSPVLVTQLEAKRNNYAGACAVRPPCSWRAGWFVLDQQGVPAMCVLAELLDAAAAPAAVAPA